MFNKDEKLAFINRTADGMRGYLKGRTESEYFKEGFIELCADINRCLTIWTGETWIGDSKAKKVRNIFQRFFTAFHDMICRIQENAEHYSQDELLYVKRIVFHGTVYRYLGSADPYNKTVVKPEYNNIYVSWSKEPQSSYIESKLYGTITWMSSEIQKPFFGIDLEGVEKAFLALTGKKCTISRGTEHEVVFPTIKECITEVKYIDRKGEEDEDDRT